LSRRGNIKRRPRGRDTHYNNELVDMLIKQVMKNGKKSLAEKIVYAAIKDAAQKSELEELDILNKAITQIKPLLEVKGRRVGGATYQVPIEVSAIRGCTLAIRWLVRYSRLRPERGMSRKLAAELIDASKGAGGAVKKREEMHKMAEANKAFAHYGGGSK